MLLALITKFKGWIAGAMFVLAVLGSAYLKGRSDGEDNANKEAEDAVEKDVEDYEDIEDRVSRMSDDELDGRLHGWSSKG